MASRNSHPYALTLSLRSLFGCAATVMIATVLACCEADFSGTPQPGKRAATDPPKLIQAGENLLAGTLTEKNFHLLLSHTHSTSSGFELGEVELENGSTLLYHVDSGRKRVWGYTVVGVRRIQWADCPQPGNCSTGPGEKFAEHFFGVSME